MKELKACPVPQCSGTAEVFKGDFAHEDFDRLMCSECTLECSREAWQMMVREEDYIESRSEDHYIWPGFLVQRWIDRVAELKNEIGEKRTVIRDLNDRLDVYREYSPLRPDKDSLKDPITIAEGKLAKIREIIGK